MAICSLCFTSCLSDLDNYESPNGGIKGQILDATTNEPIPLPVSGSIGKLAVFHSRSNLRGINCSNITIF